MPHVSYVYSNANISTGIFALLFTCVQGKKKAAASSSQEQTHRWPQSVHEVSFPRNLHPYCRPSRDHPFYKERCQELHDCLKKDVEACRVVNWDPLDTLGVRLMWPIRNMLEQRYETPEGDVYTFKDWERLFSIDEPIFPQLCWEFISTVRIDDKIEGVDDSNLIHFKLGNREYDASMLDIARWLRLYTEDEMELPYFKEFVASGKRIDAIKSDPDFHPQPVWSGLSSIPNWRAGKESYLTLRRGEHRVIHRILTHTITLRKDNREKVNLADLWFLNIINREDLHVNLPYCMTHFLGHSLKGHKVTSPICGGQYVTRIAHSLGLFNTIEPPFVQDDKQTEIIGRQHYCDCKVMSIKNDVIQPYGRPLKKRVRRASGESGGEEGPGESSGAGGRTLDDLFDQFSQMRMETREDNERAFEDLGMRFEEVSNLNEAHYVGLDARFDGLQERFVGMEQRFEQGQNAMQQDLQGMRHDLRGVQYNQLADRYLLEHGLHAQDRYFTSPTSYHEVPRQSFSPWGIPEPEDSAWPQPYDREAADRYLRDHFGQ